MKDDIGGVYAIVNKVTGTIYIGSTSRSFALRKTEHWSRLKHHDHGNAYLQRAWDKYGPDNFEFIVLQYVEAQAKLEEAEQFLLDHFRLITDVYNQSLSIGRDWCTLGKPFPSLVNRITGETMPSGVNLSKACRTLGLNAQVMRQVANGSKLSYRGWMLADGSRKNKKKKIYPALINRNTGNIVSNVENLARFCISRGLDSGTMHDVIAGRRCQHKGWALLEGARIDGRTTRHESHRPL